MLKEAKNNIKQIGSITKGQKIYIEDYVITFLKYITDKNKGKSLIFMLYGNLKQEDSEDVLYISGAVEAADTEKRGSIEVFSQAALDIAEINRIQYFSNLEAVGWCYIQPGFGDFINTDQTSYHLESFKKLYQVLYIIDPLDDSRSFFRKDENAPSLKPVGGYIIYYDKNEPMHEYLLHVKKEDSAGGAPKENLTENVDTFIGSALRRGRRPVKERKGLFSLENLEVNPQKISRLMGGLSFALLFVTLIIGGGLLKSNSRIDYIEKQISSLGKNYISLRDDVSEAQAVFAENREAEEEKTDSAAEAVTEAPTEAPTEPPTETPIASSASYREYTVKSGDTLIYLSRFFYDTADRVDDIMAANNMTEGDMLIEGKTIKIPE